MRQSQGKRTQPLYASKASDLTKRLQIGTLKAVSSGDVLKFLKQSKTVTEECPF